MKQLGWLVLLLPGIARADVPADVAVLRKPSENPVENRAAWDRLVAAGPDALMPILQAWPENDPVAANWLRTAFDRIVQQNPGKLPIAALTTFVGKVDAPGKARRMVLQTLERIQPGTMAERMPGWLNDPEFGPDSVEFQLERAAKLGDAKERLALLESTFAATRELEQAWTVSKALTQAGGQPNLLRHLGIVADWQVIGPFPVTLEEGLEQSFPPEKGYDPTATFPGKAGNLQWKAAQADAEGRMDLVKSGINPEQGAVAYARATVKVPTATQAELLVSAVDNLTVWVNGKSAIERASSYRSMFRPDRYRATVNLPAGESVILIKLTKTPAEAGRGRPGAPAKWDFLARLVGADGRGLVRQTGEGTR
ncbi:hypothetical protein [Tuwongella immobilis]|uniref:Glycosyl hydrolases family 2 sugar binding domain-containing protein n=1 Tax=Tuwongella immobilis TaxID=692036 RepID=A0A6C2YRG0_9BACT|nr:hypothetical protein [Tuwongella immobilis]VIP04250.1 Uncharacterized protein OS=Planctomyces brasiliensis (strain ATCC 49424 / DSM 5305 / JCM 21570 / NBRC 103401 / IFAM 1448) GN=Plabr_2442 PE=4 SV=1 [Tuwongella immobilis]VTS05863.1 Uncharacterized protein OS=Planctomyces brasiliensis (strain ATCC 49424 / DSM 5305 / JCM 21570 / NBRC 103401 / IFAM 1448) GN=Plabr_2442 PE=4 SV=1 [Tuwongella immobilis]